MLYARLIVMRLFKAVIVLFLIVIFNFFLIQMAPGDPAAILAGEAGAADQEFSTSCACASASTSLSTCSYGATSPALPCWILATPTGWARPSST